MARGTPQQIERNAAKAARRLKARFKNDKDWCMYDMTAEGRLLAFNMEDDPTQVIILGPKVDPAKVVLQYDQSALSGNAHQAQQENQSSLWSLPSLQEKAVANATKRTFIQIKDVVVYGEDVSDDTILRGDTEQIRGMNVLHLAGSYSDTELAKAINEAQPPGTTSVSVDNVYERIKSACKFVAKARSGSDKLWEEVREEMVYSRRRANGIVVKKR